MLRASASSSRPVLAGALALLLGVAACATTSRNPFAPANTAETQVLVFVENRGFADVRIQALSSRGARSLGTVGGNTQERLALEWRQLDQLSFRLEVLAGRTYTTQSVMASPGDHVEVIIPNNAGNTIVRLR